MVTCGFFMGFLDMKKPCTLYAGLDGCDVEARVHELGQLS
jgi:hypothetical protein